MGTWIRFGPVAIVVCLLMQLVAGCCRPDGRRNAGGETTVGDIHTGKPETEPTTSGAETEVLADEYLVLCETWNGSTLSRQMTSARLTEASQGRFAIEAQGSALAHGDTPFSVSFVSGAPEVVVQKEGGPILDRPSPYEGLATHVVERAKKQDWKAPFVEALVPFQGTSLSLGGVGATVGHTIVEANGRRWNRATLVSDPTVLDSAVGDFAVRTEATGLFVWADGEGPVAVADMTTSQQRDGRTVWSRIAVWRVEVDGVLDELAKGSGYRPPGITAETGAPVAESQMTELALVNRSLLVGGALEVECAVNPLPLVVLGLVHLADASYTLGANLAHDLTLIAMGESHTFQPFDGEVESPLERYVYRSIATGGTGLAARFGLLETDEVQAYAAFSGKVLHISGGLVGGQALHSVVSVASTGQHLAHVAWGTAAHHSGPSQAALNALGRLCYYGGQQADSTLQITDTLVKGHDFVVARETLAEDLAQVVDPDGVPADRVVVLLAEELAEYADPNGSPTNGEVVPFAGIENGDGTEVTRSGPDVLNSTYPIGTNKYVQLDGGKGWYEGWSCTVSELDRGDLDGDGSIEVAVQRCMVCGDHNACGNSWTCRMSLIGQQGGRLVDLGSAGLGSVESATISRGRLDVVFLEHGPADPRCCPSVKVSKRFEVRGNEVVEVSSSRR